MRGNHQRGKSTERFTEAEILSAIRYLDPNLEPKRTKRNPGTMCGIFVALLTMSTAVLMYICVYLWRL
jgi:hypothetical protein